MDIRKVHSFAFDFIESAHVAKSGAHICCLVLRLPEQPNKSAHQWIQKSSDIVVSIHIHTRRRYFLCDRAPKTINIRENNFYQHNKSDVREIAIFSNESDKEPFPLLHITLKFSFCSAIISVARTSTSNSILISRQVSAGWLFCCCLSVSIYLCFYLETRGEKSHPYHNRCANKRECLFLSWHGEPFKSLSGEYVFHGPLCVCVCCMRVHNKTMNVKISCVRVIISSSNSVHVVFVFCLLSCVCDKYPPVNNSNVKQKWCEFCFLPFVAQTHACSHKTQIKQTHLIQT